MSTERCNLVGATMSTIAVGNFRFSLSFFFFYGGVKRGWSHHAFWFPTLIDARKININNNNNSKVSRKVRRTGNFTPLPPPHPSFQQWEGGRSRKASSFIATHLASVFSLHFVRVILFADSVFLHSIFLHWKFYLKRARFTYSIKMRRDMVCWIVMALLIR